MTELGFLSKFLVIKLWPLPLVRRRSYRNSWIKSLQEDSIDAYGLYFNRYKGLKVHRTEQNRNCTGGLPIVLFTPNRK